MSKLSRKKIDNILSIELLESLTTPRLLGVLKSVRKRIKQLEARLSPLEQIQTEDSELSSLKTYKQQIKEILYYREDV